MSPTVLMVSGFRLVIYTNEHGPAHVHVRSAGRRAKFALSPVSLLENHGFHSRELRKIERIIVDNRRLLINTWIEFHGEIE